jgi:hypothetical protein
MPTNICSKCHQIIQKFKNDLKCATCNCEITPKTAVQIINGKLYHLDCKNNPLYCTCKEPLKGLKGLCKICY